MFVGAYKGVVTETTEYSNAPPEVHEFSADFSITAPPKSNWLQLSTKCMFTAEVLDADTIRIAPILCSLGRHPTNAPGVMADFTDDWSGGTGTLTNKTLAITIQGTRIGSNYSNGGATARFPMLVKMSVTKQ